MPRSGVDRTNDWIDDEEERRRRERARAATLGAFHPTPQQPRQQTFDRSVDREPRSRNKNNVRQGLPTIYPQSDPNDARRVARKASEVQFERDAKQMEPLNEYFSLAKAFGGQEKLAQRMKSVDALVRQYMQPHYGGDTVWALTRAPYTIPQMETMLQHATPAVYGRSRFATDTIVPRSFVNDLGLNPDNSEDNDFAAFIGKKSHFGDKLLVDARRALAAPVGVLDHFFGAVVGAQTSTYGPLVGKLRDSGPVRDVTSTVQKHNIDIYAKMVGKLAVGLPLAMVKWTGESVKGQGEALGEIATAALSGDGDALSEAGSGLALRAVESAFSNPLASPVVQSAPITEARAAAKQETEAQQLEAMKALATDPMASGSGSLKAYMDSMAWISTQDTITVQEFQESLQRPVVDAEGNVLHTGFGFEMEADGRMNERWYELAAMKAELVSRYTSLEQMMYIQESGSNLMPTGMWDKWDEDLQEWVPDEEMRELRQRSFDTAEARMKMREDHPERLAAFDMLGIPATGPERVSMLNEMMRYGYIAGMLDVPLKMAESLMMAPNAALASAELHTRLGQDEEYMAAITELRDYQVSKAIDGQKSRFAEQMKSSHFALVNYYPMSFESDPDDEREQELLAAVNGHYRRAVDQFYGPDVRGTVAMWTGASAEDTAAYREAHENGTGLVNAGSLLVAGFAFPFVKAKAFPGKSVPRGSVARAVDSPHFIEAVKKAQRLEAEGRVMEGIAHLGNNPDAAAFYQLMNRMANGEFTAASPEIATLSTDLAAAIRLGDGDAVSAALSRLKPHPKPGQTPAEYLAEVRGEFIDVVRAFDEHQAAVEAEASGVIKQNTEAGTQAIVDYQGRVKGAEATRDASVSAAEKATDSWLESANKAAVERETLRVEEQLARYEARQRATLENRLKPLEEKLQATEAAPAAEAAAPAEYAYKPLTTTEAVAGSEWHNAGPVDLKPGSYTNKAMGNQVGEGHYWIDSPEPAGRMVKQLNEKSGKADHAVHEMDPSNLKNILDTEARLDSIPALRDSILTWAEGHKYGNLIVEAINKGEGLTTHGAYRLLSRAIAQAKLKSPDQAIGRAQRGLDSIIRDAGYDAKRAKYKIPGAEGGEYNMLAVIDPAAVVKRGAAVEKPAGPKAKATETVPGELPPTPEMAIPEPIELRSTRWGELGLNAGQRESMVAWLKKEGLTPEEARSYVRNELTHEDVGKLIAERTGKIEETPEPVKVEKPVKLEKFDAKTIKGELQEWVGAQKRKGFTQFSEADVTSSVIKWAEDGQAGSAKEYIYDAAQAVSRRSKLPEGVTKPSQLVDYIVDAAEKVRKKAVAERVEELASTYKVEPATFDPAAPLPEGVSIARGEKAVFDDLRKAGVEFDSERKAIVEAINKREAPVKQVADEAAQRIADRKNKEAQEAPATEAQAVEPTDNFTQKGLENLLGLEPGKGSWLWDELLSVTKEESKRKARKAFAAREDTPNIVATKTGFQVDGLEFLKWLDELVSSEGKTPHGILRGSLKRLPNVTKAIKEGIASAERRQAAKPEAAPAAAVVDPAALSDSIVQAVAKHVQKRTKIKSEAPKSSAVHEGESVDSVLTRLAERVAEKVGVETVISRVDGELVLTTHVEGTPAQKASAARSNVRRSKSKAKARAATKEPTTLETLVAEAEKTAEIYSKTNELRDFYEAKIAQERVDRLTTLNERLSRGEHERTLRASERKAKAQEAAQAAYDKEVARQSSATLKELIKLGGNTAKNRNKLVAAQARMAEEVLARKLAYRQKGYGDILGKQEYGTRALHEAAKWYAKEGRNIFPYFANRNMKPPGLAITALRRVLSDMPAGRARDGMATLTSSFGRRVINDLTVDMQGFVEGVYDQALFHARYAPKDKLHALGYVDAADAARKLGNRAGMISDTFTADRFGMKVKELLEAAYGPQDYSMNPGGLFSQMSGRGKASYASPEMAAFTEAGTIAGRGVEAGDIAGRGQAEIRTQRLNAEGKTETVVEKRTINVPPDTPYASTGIYNIPNRYWANLHTPESMGWAARSMRDVRNIGRLVGAGLQDIGVFNRIFEVAAGAVRLFGKHLNVDTMKVAVRQPGALNRLGTRKSWNTLLDSASVYTRQGVQYAEYVRMRAVSNALHYLTETGIRKPHKARYAYDIDSGRPVDLKAVVKDLRRWVDGKVFQEYARGGRDAVVDWLVKTEEGSAFLEGSGMRNVLEHEIDAGTMEIKNRRALSPEEMTALTAERWTAEFIDGLWGQREAAMPKLTEFMKEIARGDSTRRNVEQRLFNKLEELNGKKGEHLQENPWVSAEEQLFGRNKAINKLSGFPSSLVKYAMTPNTQARVATFEHTFTRVANKMLKELIDESMPFDERARLTENIFRTAADIAEIRTYQVNFDLSQALNIEAKYRFMGWFATKTRLWHNWLLSTAALNPPLAGSVGSFLLWMEERNEKADPNLMPWERFRIKVEYGDSGNEIEVDPAPWFWLVRHAVESPLGFLVEKAAFTVPNMLGAGLQAAYSPYEEAPEKTLDVTTSLIHPQRLLPVIDGVALFTQWSMNKDKVRGWLTELPPETREKIYYNAGIIKQLDFYERKTDPEAMKRPAMTNEQAVEKAVLGNMWSQIRQLGLPPSTTIVKGFSKQRDADLQGYYEALDKQQYLKDNPGVAMGFGIHDLSPWEKDKLDSFVSQYNVIMDTYEQNVMSHYKNKTLEEARGSLVRQKKDAIEKLREDPLFDDWYTRKTGMDQFDQVIHTILPFVDTDILMKQMDRPTPDAVEEYRNTLMKQAIIDLGEQNILYDEHKSDPHVKNYIYENVTQPSNDFAGYSKVFHLPSDAEYMAQTIARAEDGGLDAADAYRRARLSEEKMAAWKKGLYRGKAKSSTPIMAILTPAEKVELGWKTDGIASLMWDSWSYERLNQKVYHKTHGISPTSKAAKAAFEAIDAKYQSLVDQHPDGVFSKEWEFSKLPLHKRLEEIGFGDYDSAITDVSAQAATGWGEFFSILDALHEDLEQLPNPSNRKKPGLSLSAMGAEETSTHYLRQIVALSQNNRDWFKDFSRYFSLRSFGFNWQLIDSSDDRLFYKPGTTVVDILDPEDPEIEFYLYGE